MIVRQNFNTFLFVGGGGKSFSEHHGQHFHPDVSTPFSESGKFAMLSQVIEPQSHRLDVTLNPTVLEDLVN